MRSHYLSTDAITQGLASDISTQIAQHEGFLCIWTVCSSRADCYASFWRQLQSSFCKHT